MAQTKRTFQLRYDQKREEVLFHLGSQETEIRPKAASEGHHICPSTKTAELVRKLIGQFANLELILQIYFLEWRVSGTEGGSQLKYI